MTGAVAIVVLAFLVTLSVGGFESEVSGDGGGVGMNNVSIVGGVQVIEVSAKGGYSPRSTVAKADMPTVLKMKTRGTFDCSVALRIPDLGFNEILPSSGETEINVPPQKAGTTLKGLCSMGMYNFAIKFE